MSESSPSAVDVVRSTGPRWGLLGGLALALLWVFVWAELNFLVRLLVGLPFGALGIRLGRRLTRPARL